MSSKEKILEKAQELFSQYGERSVSLDDISFRLGISKKTFYSFFKNKEELVLKIFEGELDILESYTRELRDSIGNPATRLMKYYSFCQEQIIKLNPIFIIQASKYYSNATVLFDDFSRRNEGFLLEILEDLYAEEMLNKWVNFESTLRAHEILFNAFIQEYTFRRDNSEKLFRHLIEANCFGLLNKKGLKSLL